MGGIVLDTARRSSPNGTLFITSLCFYQHAYPDTNTEIRELAYRCALNTTPV
jgi:hypothetical protein